jgi:ubiquinone/menaquinone biosynthesis C-methylase UbiE
LRNGWPDFEYFQRADDTQWLQVFWGAESKFFSLFQQLNLDATLEIACGTGRHSVIVQKQLKTLYLLDPSEEALRLARQRSASKKNVHYF